jgi:two-component system cell cycle response regulator DivK
VSQAAEKPSPRSQCPRRDSEGESTPRLKALFPGRASLRGTADARASGRGRYGVGIMTKLLYVEDNDDNVYMLKMRLELLGDFEVLAAEDGEKGCELAATEQPDLILMDLEMPVIDGWEATRRLKTNPQTRAIPIVALSAHALAGDREKAMAAGCDEFDTKPVEFERLVATVRRILAGRR